MNRAKLILLPSILLLLLLQTCDNQQQTPQDKAFATVVPILNQNKAIELRKVDEIEYKPLGDYIFLVKNNSNDTIVFPFDYGIKIYVFQTSTIQWLEVDNKIIYSPKEDIILYPKGKPFSVRDIHISPVLTGLDRPTSIRVVVSGYILQSNSTSEKVAAFIDLSVGP